MRFWTFLAIIELCFATPAIGQTAPQDNPTGPDHIRFYLIQSGGGLGEDLEESVVFASAGPGLAGPWSIDRSRTESFCLAKEDAQHPCRKTSVNESIEGRTCPALQRVMAQLMRVRAAEQGSAHSWVTDTPLLSLVTMQGGFMMATNRLSEYRGPLVDWWQSAQEQLKSCWNVRWRG